MAPLVWDTRDERRRAVEPTTIAATMRSDMDGGRLQSDPDLVVVGLNSERADNESRIRDDMIRVAHHAGASIRQLAEVSGLGRKIVTAIVASNARLQD